MKVDDILEVLKNPVELAQMTAQEVAHLKQKLIFLVLSEEDKLIM